ncbi:MAG: glycoside hydrolase family 43 protein [Butyrivibrio sp.]|jgi:hypothetical protein|nr:glycoside hydrolase family 43 protein [Butyrivibrio sp.]MCR4636713.1 glycoside hydrolase family 43 protein [Butyrivibrio sp.]
MSYSDIPNGQLYLDNENLHIQAHGGQIQRLSVYDPGKGCKVTKWIWVGEDKTHGAHGGIRAYSSDDLRNWTCQGIIMRSVDNREDLDTDPYFKDLYQGESSERLDHIYECINSHTSIIERPKLLYNAKNNNYVLWFHADGPTDKSRSSYAAASAGLAIARSPFGPFKFIDRYRLNTCPPDQEDFYPDSKGMARDMNLFVDDDGSAYIIYSSEENLTLYISKLNDDYTYLENDPSKAVYGRDFIRLFPGAQREAPAMFKRRGKYYLITSGCTGWAPNQARYYMADSVMGEWTNMGDPCKGDTTHTTFDSQSTCVFNACAGEEGKERYIYLGDRWNSSKLSDSSYLFLDIEFMDDDRLEISYQERGLVDDD